VQPGGQTASCIPVGVMCPGPTVGCVDTPSCGRPLVCCVSASGGSSIQTTCTLPIACLTQPGIILCNSDSDCNGSPLPRCCNRGIASICQASCN